VTEEDFITDLEKQYKEDKKKFKKTIRTLADEIIGVVDVDKTKQISLDNFVKVFKVWGHDNEAFK
jgi:mRNA-degrading endonuclease RelE of RelBE toxin-antitoxin system